MVSQLNTIVLSDDYSLAWQSLKDNFAKGPDTADWRIPAFYGTKLRQARDGYKQKLVGASESGYLYLLRPLG